MNEIFVIDSYAQTSHQLDALTTMVNHLAKLDHDICLVSHLPIPESAISSSVKYVIYDNNNIRSKEPLTLWCRFRDIAVQCYPSDSYHGAAVYASMYDALRLLAHRYAWVHFVEADVEVEAVTKYLHNGFSDARNDHEVKVIGYPFYPNDSIHSSVAIQTNLLSFRPEIADSLPLVTTWDDYLGLYQGCAPKLGTWPMLEEWLADQLLARHIKYRLLHATPIRHQSHLGGDYLIIKCRQHNARFAVFIANRSNRTLHARLSSSASSRLVPGDLWHREPEGLCLKVVVPTDEVIIAHIGDTAVPCLSQSQLLPDGICRLENGGMCLLEGVAPSEEVLITQADDTTEYHHPLETMRMGVFKRKGFDLCPDWK